MFSLNAVVIATVDVVDAGHIADLVSLNLAVEGTPWDRGSLAGVVHADGCRKPLFPPPFFFFFFSLAGIVLMVN